MKKYTGLVEAEQKLLQGAEQKLMKKLEQEKAAGIPSIPDGLKPENIGRLLEKKPEKEASKTRINWKSFCAVSGGMVAAAAMLFIICLPMLATGGGAADSANSAVMNMEMMDYGKQEMAQEALVETKAASAAVTEDAEAEQRPTGASPATGGVAETEAGALDFTIQFEGDYVASCVEGDALYILQKTSSYELYIVNLADTSDWKKINPEIPDDEVIIKLEWKDNELYVINEHGEKYVCPIKE